MKTLSVLLERYPDCLVDLPEVEVTSIVSDSRQVQSGSIFVACRGEVNDGHRFIKDAVSRGAIAVVGEKDRSDLEFDIFPVLYVKVENARQVLAELSSSFFDHPAHKLTIIGVTGTDGKTTTTNLIYRVLVAAGIRAGMISTVNAVIGDQVWDTGFHVTTPDAPVVQFYLDQMVKAGVTHVVLEATSHGLVQHRVDACEFDLAVVTNITHEHLDYHGSYENYRAAKTRLFEMLAETPHKSRGNYRIAVLNRDDRSYPFLSQVCSTLTGVRVFSYGLDPNGDMWAEDVQRDSRGLRFEAVSGKVRVPISSSLVGDYNVSNILAAVSVTVNGLGIQPDTATTGISAFPGVPGRMERIDLGQPFTAVVDFAHTPNALQRTLETARVYTPEGKVIAVFGSAGLRDRQKRRMMAEVSARLADFSILTAEDPRTESLDGILEEMAAGAQAQGGKEGVTFWRIPDRRAAIRFAVNIAKPGDMILACGKGHEQSMCFGIIEYPWDDRVAMKAALSELLGLPGQPMPFLPVDE